MEMLYIDLRSPTGGRLEIIVVAARIHSCTNISSIDSYLMHLCVEKAMDVFLAIDKMEVAILHSSCTRTFSSTREETCLSLLEPQCLLGVRTTYSAAKSLQSCLTLCDPIDSSPQGSLVPGILQPKTLVWVVISFSNA